MKIKKRYGAAGAQPVAIDDVEPMMVAFKRDATTDTELYSTQALMAEFEEEGALDDGFPDPVQTSQEADAFPRLAVSRPEPLIVPIKAARTAKAPSGWPIYLIALFVSAMWAGAPIAFAYGYRQAKSPFDFDPFVMLVLSAMAIGPAALVWVAAYMIQQGRRLGAETARAKTLADELIAPTLAAGLQAGEIARTMREEIASAGQAALEARETLQGLREALSVESQRLLEAATQSAQAAGDLTRTLASERVEMSSLSQTLETRSAIIAQAITEQTRKVSEASDLAEAQLREAEASLTARAADLTAAAGVAGDTARTAGEDLTRHIARLEMAGLGVAEQISTVDKGLSEQRAGLVTITHALRADQDLFAEQAETHAAQLTDFISQTRMSAAEMGDHAVKGGEALQGLIAAATQQFGELAQAAKDERDAFEASTLEALGAVSNAAAEERSRLEAQTREAIQALSIAAEKTRVATDQHAETAREQVDQLSEAAFSAGQKANRVFETRLTEAKELIERSADMVEQAGAATARKLEEGTAAAKIALNELSTMLADIEARASRMPAAARGQAEEVRLAVSESMDDLVEQARHTARETQAIDAAFQDRVRRNYEMLTDAVRLMGSVAGATGTFTSVPSATPPLEAEPARAPRVRLTRPVAEAVDDPQDLSKVPRATGKRTRLKLTPTASDAEFSHVFEEAGGRSAPKPQSDTDGWTWKDLLTSLDAKDTVSPATPLDDSLIEDILDMGLDSAVLLPGSRIEQIAAALEADDGDGARQVVRKLAPAATRRLARHLSEDDAFRRRTLSFLGHYQDQLAETLDTNPADLARQLGTDAGRCYLLLEAASADLV